jgi:hypothetical protein
MSASLEILFSGAGGCVGGERMVRFPGALKGLPMKNPLSEIIGYFKSQDWSFIQDDKLPLLRMGFSGENGAWRCVAVIERDETQFSFLSYFPCKAPAKFRLSCSELLTRTNYGMYTGAFYMDWRNGEILMKTSTVIPMRGLSEDTIDPIVGINLATMDHFFPAFMKVIYAGAKPQEALEQADEKLEAPPRFELN